MADLICFYQDITNKIPQIEDFDYRSAVEKLRNTYKQFNKGEFTLISEFNTERLHPIPQFDHYQVVDMPNESLMENVCIANCYSTHRKPGRYVLCGCDHLINGDLEQMFDGTFNLGIMMVKGRVNNTVILIDTDYTNHHYVEAFFDRRLRIYETLNARMKRWGGDQYSIQRLLEEDLILPEKKRQIYDCMGLKLKLFDYRSNGISGVSKSSATFDPKSVFVDFKGKERKRFYDQVYTYITLRGSQLTS